MIKEETGPVSYTHLIFFCCLLAGIVANVCMPMFLHTPRVVCVFLFLGCILVGIAFGCNYTEDLTYGKYLYCYFFKPVKTLRYESTEDIELIKKRAEELKKEEDLLLKRERNANPREQRKLLVRLLAFVPVSYTHLYISGNVQFCGQCREWNRTIEDGKYNSPV